MESARSAGPRACLNRSRAAFASWSRPAASTSVGFARLLLLSKHQRVPGRGRRRERVGMFGSAMPRSALRLTSLSSPLARPAYLPRPLRCRSRPAVSSSFSTKANTATSYSRTLMAAVAASAGLAAAAFATTYNKSVSLRGSSPLCPLAASWSFAIHS